MLGSHLQVHGQVCRKLPRFHLRIRRVSRAGMRNRLSWLHVVGEAERGEALQKADEEEGHLVVRELLAEADARAGVEGEEDVRVVREVLSEAGVEEAVGVEFAGWR